jgi:hypothetical protein
MNEKRKLCLMVFAAGLVLRLVFPPWSMNGVQTIFDMTEHSVINWTALGVQVVIWALLCGIFFVALLHERAEGVGGSGQPADETADAARLRVKHR